MNYIEVLKVLGIRETTPEPEDQVELAVLHQVVTVPTRPGEHSQEELFAEFQRFLAQRSAGQASIEHEGTQNSGRVAGVKQEAGLIMPGTAHVKRKNGENSNPSPVKKRTKAKTRTTIEILDSDDEA